MSTSQPRRAFSTHISYESLYGRIKEHEWIASVPFAMSIRKVLRLEVASDGSDGKVNECTAISINLVAEVPVGDVCRSTPALSAVKQHRQMEA